MIGLGPAPTFDEPLEMLAACHERIEAQLSTLERLAEYIATNGCDGRAADAARAVLRYFDTAGVMHHRDEDEDLFPLLRGHAALRKVPEVAAIMDQLGREHASMDAQWAALRPRLEAIADGRGQPLSGRQAKNFAWLYRRHMDNETKSVLPFARKVMTEEERRALGARMAARRKA